VLESVPERLLGEGAPNNSDTPITLLLVAVAVEKRPVFFGRILAEQLSQRTLFVCRELKAAQKKTLAA
jgi:hypothetical protein